MRRLTRAALLVPLCTAAATFSLSAATGLAQQPAGTPRVEHTPPPYTRCPPPRHLLRVGAR